jgi:hypothetical protein
MERTSFADLGVDGINIRIDFIIAVCVDNNWNQMV